MACNFVEVNSERGVDKAFPPLVLSLAIINYVAVHRIDPDMLFL